MKYLRFILALLIAISAIAVIAQDSDVTFVNANIDEYGISSLVPDGWQNPVPGTYARGATATDGTVLVIQSFPLTIETLQSALTGQLGITEFPESEVELETDIAVWSVYRVDVESVGLSVTLAMTNIDDVTYLLLSQSATDEHDVMRETIFMPVLESIALLAGEDDTEEVSDIPYSEEEITFESGDNILAGTLTIPEGEGEFPVVVLVSGSGAQDRDESLEPLAEIKPFRDIADYLTRNGIAVLRYDERGVGASEGDIFNADLYDFRDDANAAINYLAERNEFSQIGILGHSEGGTYAPEIGLTNDNVDFVVALAGATNRIIDVLPYQVQALAVAGGADEEDGIALNETMIALIEAYDSDDDEAFNDAIRAYAEAQPGDEEVSEQVVELLQAQFASPIYVSYFDYDAAPFWLEVDVPTLAVYGTLDLQVSAEESVAFLDGMNDNITIVTIENMNHIFQLAETGALSEYGTLEQTVLPELLETVADWILEITAQ